MAGIGSRRSSIGRSIVLERRGHLVTEALYIPLGPYKPNQAGFQAGCGMNGQAVPLQWVGSRYKDLDSAPGRECRQYQGLHAGARSLPAMAARIVRHASTQAALREADITDDPVNHEDIDAWRGGYDAIEGKGGFFHRGPFARSAWSLPR